MAINEWQGGAPAVAQVTVFLSPEVVGKVDFLIGTRSLGYTGNWEREPVGPNFGATTRAIVSAWQQSTLPEFQAISAQYSVESVIQDGQTVQVPALRLTAKTAGEPFEVSARLNGAAYTNEVQKVALVNSPTGGTFTLTFDGQTTAGIAYNASAAAVQSALEALSNIAPGDVTVTKSDSEIWNQLSPAIRYPVWTIAFAAAFANLNAPTITASASGLTGGNCQITVTTEQAGISPTNEVQLVTLTGNVTGGTFTLTVPGSPAATVAWNASASAVATALNGVLGSGAVTCSGGSLPGTAVSVTFSGGSFAGVPLGLMVADGSLLTAGAARLTVATTTSGAAGTNYKARWRILSDPAIADSGGRTAWEYRVQLYLNSGYFWESEPLNYEMTASEVQAKLADMIFQNTSYGEPAFLGATGVTVTGSLDNSWASPSNYMEIELTGQWHSTPVVTLAFAPNVAQTATNNHNVTRSTTVVSNGVAGTNEVQTITQSGSGAGSFRLSFGGEKTDPIPYDATATQIEQELVKLSTIGMSGTTGVRPNAYITADIPNLHNLSWSANAVCTGGPLGTSPVTVTFRGGGLQSKNVAALQAIEGDATVTRTTAGDPGRLELQRVQLGAGTPPRAGTWTLTYSGQTASGLAWNISAPDLLTALEGLSNLDPGQVAVNGSLSGGFLVSFSAALGNVAQMTANASGLANGLVYVRTETDGGQLIRKLNVKDSRGPWHGDDPLNWTLNHVPDSGEDLLFQFGKTGPRWGITWLSTFTVSPVDSTYLICTNDLKTGQKVIVDSSGTLPTGLAADTPYWVTRIDAENIQLSASLGGAPISCSGGSGTHRVYVRIASLKTLSTWTGWAGTLVYHESGFREYRPLYWKVGFVAGARVTIGEGEGGSASPLFRLNMSDFQVVPEVLSTQGSKESTLPACLLLATWSDLSLSVVDGEVGLALLAGEVSTVKMLTIRGGSVLCGAGVTFPAGAKVDRIRGTFDALGSSFTGNLLLRG